MRLALGLLMIAVLGCRFTPAAGDDDTMGDDDPPANDAGIDPRPPLESCLGGNNCVCPAIEPCNHTCSAGASECHVQGMQRPVDVTCNDNVECHVECGSAASCEVDCGGSTQCHVSCPATGCTVTNCVGDCVVSCGGVTGATLTGTTATCP